MTVDWTFLRERVRRAVETDGSAYWVVNHESDDEAGRRVVEEEAARLGVIARFDGDGRDPLAFFGRTAAAAEERVARWRRSATVPVVALPARRA